MAVEATVCLVRQNGRLLLQRKAAGRFGGGRWNAPGGKLRVDESPADCAVREVLEETGLKVLHSSPCGRFEEYFGACEEPAWIVHVFTSSRFSGELQPNAEGLLRWFPEDRLPYARMWPSDRLWVPHVLAGGEFEATFWFDAAARTLLRQEVVLNSRSAGR